MRIVYTAGVWDLLHRGHVNFLWQAKSHGAMLVVGVITDAGTEAYKHRRPVESLMKRLAAIDRLAFVDAVVVQEETDPTPQLVRWLPDVFCHADGDGDWGYLHDQVAALGIEYVNIPYTPGISSTMLREIPFKEIARTTSDVRHVG